MKKKINKLTIPDKIFVGILLAIFGGIVLHAPFTAAFGTLFPSADIYLKSWKEILMVIAVVFAGYLLFKRKMLLILKNPLVLLSGFYVFLHLLMLPFEWQGTLPAIAGVLIDTRYVVFFVLVYVAVMLYPTLRRKILITVGAGAMVVVVFGLLQVFVLPRDVLELIGYSEHTIIPYLLVDANDDFVRINSTLRGPNPLGAYVAIILPLIVTFVAAHKLGFFSTKMRRITLVVLTVSSLVTLWASYSRSALVAAIAGLGIVGLVLFFKKIPKWLLIGGVVVSLLGCFGLYTIRDTYFVSNILLHENSETGGPSSSNQGHMESLEYGIDRMIHQPLGGGIGSTGSASLLGDSPLIIENQYLFIAHETGWLGLIIFLVLFITILVELWKRRKDWLALGVFASGIGMALIAILLPVWADDTVAIIWWGLAALALGGRYGTLDKKTKRTT